MTVAQKELEKRQSITHQFIEQHKGKRTPEMDALKIPSWLVVAGPEDVLPDSSVWENVGAYAIPLKPAMGEEGKLEGARKWNHRLYNRDAFYVLLFCEGGPAVFLVNPKDLKKGEFTLHEIIDNSWQADSTHRVRESDCRAYMLLSSVVPCESAFQRAPVKDVPPELV